MYYKWQTHRSRSTADSDQELLLTLFSQGHTLSSSGFPRLKKNYLEEWDGVGDGRELQEGGDIGILTADYAVVWQKPYIVGNQQTNTTL